MVAPGIASSHEPDPALNWWPGARCEPPLVAVSQGVALQPQQFLLYLWSRWKGGKIEGKEWICSSPSKTEGCWGIFNPLHLPPS